MVKFTNVNWDDAPDYEPLEPGIYDAVADTSESETRKAQSGAVGFSMRFLVRDPKTGDTRKVYKTYYMSGKGLGFTKAMVRALGLPAEGIEEVFDTQTLHGRRCRVRLGIQRDNPRFNDVLDVLPPKAQDLGQELGSELGDTPLAQAAAGVSRDPFA